MLDNGGLKFPTNQAELGVAALKIGGTLFSGMKAIGGRAYSAARAGVSAALSGETSSISSVTPGKFISRSAPETSPSGHERRPSMTSDIGSNVGSNAEDPTQAGVLGPSFPREQARSQAEGHYITILDLERLNSSGRALAEPTIIGEYMISRHEAISNLAFSADGTSVVVALQGGRVAKVYQLRPVARAYWGSMPALNLSSKESVANPAVPVRNYAYNRDLPVTPQPWHIYDLRRGRTSAVIEQLSWAQDGRWLGIGTRKRTIHIFALNPYGGPPDEASHVEGRVVNVAEMVRCRVRWK